MAAQNWAYSRVLRDVRVPIMRPFCQKQKLPEEISTAFLIFPEHFHILLSLLVMDYFLFSFPSFPLVISKRLEIHLLVIYYSTEMEYVRKSYIIKFTIKKVILSVHLNVVKQIYSGC